jgi:hypothetical protein
MNFPVPSRNYLGDLARVVGDYMDKFTRFWNGHNQGKLIWDRMIAFGTGTNDNAATGIIGEAVRSYNTVSLSGSGVYTVVSSLDLTAGDWDLSFVANVGNSAITPVTLIFVIISSSSGDNGIGSNLGDNSMGLQDFNNASSDASLPAWRLSLSASATWYMKCKASYAAGSPYCTGRFSARRIR